MAIGDDIKKAKDIAHKNRSRKNYAFLFGIVSGLLCSLAFWSLTSAAHPKEIFSFGLLGGATTSLVVLKVFKSKIFYLAAKCPACGYSWEIKEGRAVPEDEKMPNWLRCPGCNLYIGHPNP